MSSYDDEDDAVDQLIRGLRSLDRAQADLDQRVSETTATVIQLQGRVGHFNQRRHKLTAVLQQAEVRNANLSQQIHHTRAAVNQAESQHRHFVSLVADSKHAQQQAFDQDEARWTKLVRNLYTCLDRVRLVTPQHIADGLTQDVDAAVAACVAPAEQDTTTARSNDTDAAAPVMYHDDDSQTSPATGLSPSIIVEPAAETSTPVQRSLSTDSRDDASAAKASPTLVSPSDDADDASPATPRSDDGRDAVAVTPCSDDGDDATPVAEMDVDVDEDTNTAVHIVGTALGVDGITPLLPEHPVAENSSMLASQPALHVAHVSTPVAAIVQRQAEVSPTGATEPPAQPTSSGLRMASPGSTAQSFSPTTLLAAPVTPRSSAVVAQREQEMQRVAEESCSSPLKAASKAASPEPDNSVVAQMPAASTATVKTEAVAGSKSTSLATPPSSRTATALHALSGMATASYTQATRGVSPTHSPVHSGARNSRSCADISGSGEPTCPPAKRNALSAVNRTSPARAMPSTPAAPFTTPFSAPQAHGNNSFFENGFSSPAIGEAGAISGSGFPDNAGFDPDAFGDAAFDAPDANISSGQASLF